MWSRAVWLEGDQEEELVIPKTWIQGKYVYWPNKMNAAKALREMEEPTEKWRRFKLLKVKISSAIKQECEDFCLTTTTEVSDDEQLPAKRNIKRKRFPDFVSDKTLYTDEEDDDDGDGDDDDDDEGVSNKSSDIDHFPMPDTPQKITCANSPLRTKSIHKRTTTPKHSSPADEASKSIRSMSPSKVNGMPMSFSARKLARERSSSERSQSVEEQDSYRPHRSRSRSRSLIRERYSDKSRSNRSRSPRSVSERYLSRSPSMRRDRYYVKSRSNKSRSPSTVRERYLSRSDRSRSPSMRGDRYSVKSRSNTSRSPSTVRERYSPRSDRSRSRSIIRERYSKKPRLDRSRSRSKTRERYSEMSRSNNRSRSYSNVRCLEDSNRESLTGSNQWSVSPVHAAGVSRDTVTEVVRQDLSRKLSPERDNFPMSEKRFQKKLFHKLCSIESLLMQQIRRQEPVQSDFHVETLTSRDEYMNCEDKMKIKEEQQLMVSRLSKIGGDSLKDNTFKVMARLFTNALMSEMNMKGGSSKIPFGDSQLMQTVIDSVIPHWKQGTEANVRKHVSDFLKQAPFRKGGLKSRTKE